MPFKSQKKNEDTPYRPTGWTTKSLKKRKHTRSHPEANHEADLETPLQCRSRRNLQTVPTTRKGSSSPENFPKRSRKDSFTPELVGEPGLPATITHHQPFSDPVPNTPMSHHPTLYPETPDNQAPSPRPMTPLSDDPPVPTAPHSSPMSILMSSPPKPQGGRSRVKNPIRNPRGYKQSDEYKEHVEKRQVEWEAQVAREREYRKEMEEEEYERGQRDQREKTNKAHDVIKLITKDESDGGLDLSR
ncbi:hypothetical protein K435DRAFT_874224 [Dendrothele bispora CBS 962.96]|uniref:Uncharacterized protein n=1 Tax=Dendrothele bispora (strain CBS 962.96) TaxID=1314807 RepID=A0A4S8KX61_DENBC|nr:hypothetical protein K435DRAFT_874224 [Dendrothele bispora CBS 962.96]